MHLLKEKLDSRFTTSTQSEIQSSVNAMRSTFDDKYETIDDELSTIRSSIGSVKYGLTSQIRKINVSYIDEIFVR